MATTFAFEFYTEKIKTDKIDAIIQKVAELADYLKQHQLTECILKHHRNESPVLSIIIKKDNDNLFYSLYFTKLYDSSACLPFDHLAYELEGLNLKQLKQIECLFLFGRKKFL